jgi:hypothetical protein
MCYKCSFEEVGDPSIKTIIVSASALDTGVSFRVQADGNYTGYNSGIELTKTVNSSFNSTVYNVGTEETFVGWSLTEDGSGYVIEDSQTYNHTVTDDVTIYALVRLSDGIGIDFCYYSTSNMNTICNGTCSTTKTVYFDRDDYATTPIEDLIWYEDPSLTTKSDEGYYRRKTTRTFNWLFGFTYTRTIVDDTIYFVSGSTYPTPGEANVYDTCGDFIYCS